MEMNTKNLMVSFVAIAMALFLVATISACCEMTTDYAVEVEGIDAYHNEVSVIAGETISVKVYFTAENCDTDVTIEAELEGDKVDVEVMTSPFDVEENQSYRKVLKIKVPYELKDQRSDDVALNIEIDGKKYKTELTEINLRVQRPSYNADIKSISVPQNVEAGESFPVDIVLKNIGYNDLDDLYVVVSIPELGIKQNSYFGDLVALECCDDECSVEHDDDCADEEACPYECCSEDDEDTTSGRLYLKIPYDVESGIYSVEVEVTNEDTTNTAVKQIVINNDFSENVIVTSLSKTVAVNEDAEYSLLIVNPTNKLKVYKVVTESSESLSASANEAVVAVPAGSSKTIRIIANANSEGEYNFNVNVFSGDELVKTVTLSLNTTEKSITSPIVVLTIVLAIVFLVLLVVLIVLITKKPEKSEEFGESYY